MVFWMNEEYGIVGGKVYVVAYKDQLYNHVVVIELDLGGFVFCGFRL